MSVATARILTPKWDGAPPRAVLEWAVQAYAEGLVVASAFGPGTIVILDLLHRMGVRLPVIFVDTLHHFPETLEHVATVRQRYRLDLRVHRPAPDRAAFERAHGARLWERDLDRYERVAKVAPFRRAVREYHAYLSGRRRDQSPSRSDLPIHEPGRPARINPLATWGRQDVWRYIRLRGLPYNPLHDHGYASIGDEPLTTPVAAGEDERAGRWRGDDRLECGIHHPIRGGEAWQT